MHNITSVNAVGRLHEAIEKWSSQYGLRFTLIQAIMMVETGGNGALYRYEPVFFEKYLKDIPVEILGGFWPKVVSRDTERNFRAVSWGHMQVMGQTARELGFSMDSFLYLAEPETGIQYGCAYLRQMLNRFQNEIEDPKQLERQAVAAYNGGPGSPNFKYANKVYDREKNLNCRD